MKTMAGMASRLSRCTPMLRPIRKAISTIQRRAYGSSARSYQTVMSQNTTAVNREDIAYTSPSTAENQNVSEKAYTSAPTRPEPKMATACATP